MSHFEIVSVSEENIGDLDLALRALSAEMGDNHVVDVDALKTGFLRNGSAFTALIAYTSGDLAGVIVWSPQFSTTRGGGGLYVSDLWVASSARGRGVGRKLLIRALSDADQSSGSRFLKLAVHRTNPNALAYYKHIGFREDTDMLSMTLDGAALQRFGKA